MKKRFIYLVIFTAAMVYIVGSVFFFAICAGLRKTSSDAVGKFNFILNDKTYYNTLFVGPSTLHLGADPLVFDSATNHQTNSFNAAMDGISLLEMDLIIHKYFKSHGVPKTIYLNIAGNTLVTDSSLWFFSQYYPFVNDPDFLPLVQHEPKLLYGRYCPPLAVTYFNDPLRSLGLIGLLSHRNGLGELKSQKGYLRSNKVISSKNSVTDMEFRERNDGWKILDGIVSFCRKSNVELVLVLTPMYNAKLNPAALAVIDKIRSVAGKNNVQVIDLISDERFAFARLFADRRHMNSNGAYLLSSTLAAEYNLTHHGISPEASD